MTIQLKRREWQLLLLAHRFVTVNKIKKKIHRCRYQRSVFIKYRKDLIALLTAFASMVKFCTSNSVNVASLFSFIRFIIFIHRFSHTGIASTNSIRLSKKVASPHELIKNRPTFSSKPGITNGAWIRSIGDDLQSAIVVSLTRPSKLINASMDGAINSGYLNRKMEVKEIFFKQIMSRLALTLLDAFQCQQISIELAYQLNQSKTKGMVWESCRSIDRSDFPLYRWVTTKLRICSQQFAVTLLQVWMESGAILFVLLINILYPESRFPVKPKRNGQRWLNFVDLMIIRSHDPSGHKQKKINLWLWLDGRIRVVD